MIGNGVRKTLAAVTNNDSVIFAAVLLMSMEELPYPSPKPTRQHNNTCLTSYLRQNVGLGEG